MATIDLQQTDTDITVQVGCSGRSLTASSTAGNRMTDGGTAGTTEDNLSLDNFESLVVAYNDISDNIGETIWAAGNYTWRLDVTSGNAAISLEEIYVCRLNQAEVNQETLGSATAIGQALGTAQVYSNSISCSAATSPLETDRLALIYVFSNSSEHGGADAIGITPSQIINTPIERTAAAGRIMSSLVDHGGLAGHGGIAGTGGGLAG